MQSLKFEASFLDASDEAAVLKRAALTGNAGTRGKAGLFFLKMKRVQTAFMRNNMFDIVSCSSFDGYGTSRWTLYLAFPLVVMEYHVGLGLLLILQWLWSLWLDDISCSSFRGYGTSGCTLSPALSSVAVERLVGPSLLLFLQWLWNIRLDLEHRIDNHQDLDFLHQ